jgi:hypothetical protein
MRPFPLFGSVLVLCVSAMMAQAAGKAPSRAEPAESLLPPVDPAWRAIGWRPVVPHAFVLRKLLPVRTAPRPDAPVAFYLNGGTRVPVVEQGVKWWRISWTQDRTGWAPSRDLESHASFVLIDTRTGRVVRRIAAKGQWGAVSDGKALWSLSNSGITRTRVEGRPAFWARNVAADRDALFPKWSVWDSQRQQFFLRSGGEAEGSLLHADARTGHVRIVGSPPPGGLAGLTPAGAVVLSSTSGAKELTHVYAPSGPLRKITGSVQAVTRSGALLVTKDEELIRYDAQLRVTGRASLPRAPLSVRLSADERYVAASYEADFTQDDSPSRVGIFDARTLKRVRTLTLRSDLEPLYLVGFGHWKNGWWLAGAGEGEGKLVARFSSKGRLLTRWEGFGPAAVSADGTQVFLTGEERILAIQPATGRRRSFPFTWRRPLPARYLPAPTTPDFPVRLSVSSLTVSPDGNTLILTEWLNGDPEG